MDLNNESILHLLENNPEQALIELRRLFCHAKQEESQEVHEIIYWIAKVHFKLTQFDTVRKLMEYWLVNHTLDSNIEMRMQNILAVVYNVMGYLPDAFTYYSEVLKKAESAHDEQIQVIIYTNLGRMMTELGDYEKAKYFYQKSLPLTTDQPLLKARANLYYALVALHLDETEEAFFILNQAKQVFVSLEDFLRMGYVIEIEGDFALYQGNLSHGLHCYNQALSILAKHGDKRDIGTLQQKRGALLMGLYQYDEAIGALISAIEHIKGANIPLIIKDAYYQLALAYEATGQSKLAIEAYKAQSDYLKEVHALQVEQQIRMIDIHLEKSQIIKEKEKVNENQWQLQNSHVHMLDETESIGVATENIQQLKQLALALTSAKNIQEIQDIAVQYLYSMIDCEQFMLGFVDDAGEAILMDTMSKGNSAHLKTVISLDQSGYFQHAVLKGQIINLSNEEATTFFMEQVQDSPHSAIYVPLKESGKVFGICVVFHHAQRHYDIYDEAVFVGYCSVIASAITILKKNAQIHLQRDLHQQLLVDLKKKNAVLSDLSYHDALTGLYNRAGMAYSISQWLMSTPIPCEMVVAVMDLDYFKQFNDEYGHLMGDRLIQQMGILIRRIFSKEDYLLTRFGGEEFLLIASSRYFMDIIVESESLRTAMPEITMELAIDKPLSISIGIKSDCVTSPEDLYRLIDGADQQLYRAKQTGRNRVCSA